MANYFNSAVTFIKGFDTSLEPMQLNITQNQDGPWISTYDALDVIDLLDQHTKVSFCCEFSTTQELVLVGMNKISYRLLLNPSNEAKKLHTILWEL